MTCNDIVGVTIVAIVCSILVSFMIPDVALVKQRIDDTQSVPPFSSLQTYVLALISPIQSELHEMTSSLRQHVGTGCLVMTPTYKEGYSIIHVHCRMIIRGQIPDNLYLWAYDNINRVAILTTQEKIKKSDYILLTDMMKKLNTLKHIIYVHVY
jgi:hypothetical protein